MKQRHGLRAQRNFEPELIELIEPGPGSGDAENLRNRLPARHQLEIRVDAAVVIHAPAGIYNEAFGLLRAADDDLLVRAALNEALRFVVLVIVIPDGRLAVLLQHKAHRRGEQLHAL